LFPGPSCLLDWVGLLTLAGFLVMGVDKLLAKGGFSRIRERTIWLLSLVGGFVGVILGGLVFHHKTSKPGFWGPVAASALVWALVLVYSHQVMLGF